MEFSNCSFIGIESYTLGDLLLAFFTFDMEWSFVSHFRSWRVVLGVFLVFFVLNIFGISRAARWLFKPGTSLIIFFFTVVVMQRFLVINGRAFRIDLRACLDRNPSGSRNCLLSLPIKLTLIFFYNKLQTNFFDTNNNNVLSIPNYSGFEPSLLFSTEIFSACSPTSTPAPTPTSSTGGFTYKHSPFLSSSSLMDSSI